MWSYSHQQRPRKDLATLLTTKKIAHRLSADWITIIFLRLQGSRLGRAHIYFSRWKILVETKSIFMFTFMFEFPKSHCLSIIVWSMVIVGNLRSLCQRFERTEGCCLLDQSLFTLVTIDHSLHVDTLCHTYLKLVQMISWSRCLSACDCVMTGCCNILSPFISRHTSMMWRHSPGVSSAPDGVTRRREPIPALTESGHCGLWASEHWASHSRLLCWPVD